MTRATDILVLSSVTDLPRDFAFKIGARVGGEGGTIASRFIAELGPTAPAPKNGAIWAARNFA